MLAVLDTNVVISGLFWKSGNPRKILELWELGVVELLFSEDTLKELSDVLDRYFKIPNEEISDILKFILEKSSLVNVKSSVDVCRDMGDNKFLELALNGKADYIVSGDKDLLELKNFNGIKILNPREFLKEIKR